MTAALLFVLALGAGAWGYTAWHSARTERLYPPLGDFVEVDGARLHYVDRGAGVPVVLIHGASGNLRDFAVSIMDDLARDHRVIAFDRPGHGWSTRPARPDIHDPAAQAALINKALRKLGVGRHVLLGHSWGGAVAVAYALNHPQDLIGIVPLGAATHPWPGGVAWYHRLVRTPVLGDVFLNTAMVPVAQLLRGPGIAGTFEPQAAPSGYGEAIGLDLVFRPASFAANSADVSHLKAALARMAPRYREIRVPTIIIHGGGDRTVGFKLHAEPLHAAVAGSELIRLRQTGHMPHHARPDIVADAVARLARGEKPVAGLRVVEPGGPLPPPDAVQAATAD